MPLQMTWHPQHRRAGPPRGLKNLGNTCYLNSVLQCLAHTPPLAQFCLSSQHSSLCKSVIINREKECAFCIVERQIARLLNPPPSTAATSVLPPPAPADTPSKLLKSLALFAEHFKWGRQEDAHEFLRYVIDTCHTACARLAKARAREGGGSGGGAHGSQTVMREVFGGALLSQVKCMGCKGESNKTDEMMDLSLDLCQTGSVKDALSRFFQPEVLDGPNKYSCERCKKLSVARKQMFVVRAPNVLVIQLKRFEGINGGKINRNIEFEEVLLLSNFMFNSSQDHQPEYNLFGSIVHSGFSPESGHYYSYIKDASGNWYCCNDSQVTLSSPKEVLSEKVYILFYLLKNPNPKSNKSVKNGYTCTPIKSSDSNGNGHLKPPVTKQNGAGPTSRSNGKTTPNLQPTKLIGPVNLEIKKPASNSPNKTEIKNNNIVIKKNKTVMSSPSSSGSSGEPRPPFKAKASISNGRNGYVQLKEGPENNSQRDPDRPSNHNMGEGKASESALTCKKESENLTKKDGLSKKESRSIWCSAEELEKIKQVLVSEASSELRLSGWAGEVHNFMRAKKRLCVQQAAGKSPDIGLLREQLVSESRKKFNSQIPESVKGNLIQQLRSFTHGKSLLDSS